MHYVKSTKRNLIKTQEIFIHLNIFWAPTMCQLAHSGYNNKQDIIFAFRVLRGKLVNRQLQYRGSTD